MNPADIEKYIVSYFGDAIVNGSLSATFEDLRLDSLGLVEFVMHLEEKYNIQINADDIDEKGNVGQFCTLVERALNAKKDL
jgi:acyl carrier protein